ncbi:sensor histidine kinase [Naasia sp. SYSU D00057]|uniref:sensor histidine kinase n=1 Tax=Naasia sp. SYSU D00057 TaxID=2817380 RepID=UPI001B310A52|nr:sensor histidine kinase [Naasia sp. SYSU D00057]
MADPQTDEWVRPAPSRSDLRRDVITAVALAGGVTLSVVLYSIGGVYDNPAPWWASALYVAFTTLPLALRRRCPGVVAVVVSVAYGVGMGASVPDLFFGNVTLFLAFYSLGAWGRNRAASRLLRMLIIVGMFLWLFLDLGIRFSNPELLAQYTPGASPQAAVAIALLSILINLLFFGAAYVFGDRAWASARAFATLEQRTAELTAERERTAAQAVVLERVRIARELHDVVAHHVSVMGVQAGAARRVLDRDPARAAESLAAIEESARSAVDDLHRMLGTLRSEETESAPPPSTLGVEQLDDLVRQAGADGRTARYATVGTPRPLEGTVGNTLYRVTQEALTNSIKHAGPAAEIDVRLRYLDDAVELEVSDTGGRPARHAGGAGLGQVGMRERVGAVGGTLELGPSSRGGYLVRASIPTGR